MVHTFHIDGTNEKAKALMDFLRTLEFVKEDESDWGKEVSSELETSILKGLKDEKDGKILSNDTVMSELRNEFPHLNL